MQIEVRIVGKSADVDDLVDILQFLGDVYKHGDLTWVHDYDDFSVLRVSKKYPRRNEPGNVAVYLQIEIQ